MASKTFEGEQLKVNVKSKAELEKKLRIYGATLERCIESEEPVTLTFTFNPKASKNGKQAKDVQATPSAEGQEG